MAGHRARQAQAKAQAQRIGADYGLGGHTGTATGSRSTRRHLPGGFALAVAVLVGAILLPAKFPEVGSSPAYMKALPVILFGVPIAMMVRIAVMLAPHPGSTAHTYTHTYEEGAALVTEQGQVTAVRLADLAALSIRASVASYSDDEFVSFFSMTDQAGNTVSVTDTSVMGRGGLLDRAEQVLLDRHLGPLTARLDAGDPVTIGCLTVDRWGIRSRAAGRRDSWDIPWPEAHDIVTRVHGQRVIVTTYRGGRRGDLQARLDGEPNGFLAGHLLQHMAGRAGVPFHAYAG